MDIFALAVGFVAGVFTSAAGHYFGEKYTDERRSKELRKQQNKEWSALEKRFPKIIAEMKADVTNPAYSNVREFFVKSSRTSVNTSKQAYEYHTDVHPDLSAAIDHLEELSYIIDITEEDCPHYRMKEDFVDKLKDSNSKA